MAITLFKSSDIGSTMRCTIHLNGRLTFSLFAIQKLNLYQKWGIELGHEDSDLKNKNLYMFIYEIPKEGAFRINESRPYCYINTRELFEYLKYDYKDMRIFFNIVEVPSSHEQKSFQLLYRERERT
jgi:hypothetical protein